MRIEKMPSAYLQDTRSLKISNFQNLGSLYNLVICSLLMTKGEPLNICELGVTYFGHGSGHAFSEMEYVSKYVGVDIEPVENRFGGIFVLADVDSLECVEELRKHAPFDLIIHDADHHPETQIYFFQNYHNLFGEHGGIMMCEDVFHPDVVLSALNDNSIHVMEVPPIYSAYSTVLLKFIEGEEDHANTFVRHSAYGDI